jgi:hypothetical protein
MMRNLFHYITLVAFAAYGSLGCESGGVGAPCTPEDEYNQDFNGFALTEVNVESRSFQCETRVCIVNHFQGRVSCPYGQLDPATSNLAPEDRARCRVPGSNGKTCADAQGNVTDCNGGTNIDEIRVPVDPQRVFRAAQDTVYCSCRCKGPDANAVYCECPSGFECKELVRDIGVTGRGQLVGNYCIKPGTEYDPTHPPDPQVCTIADGDANKTLTSTNRKQRKAGDICGETEAGCPDGVSKPCASNPPL